MLMTVAITRYTEHQGIDNCNAKTGLSSGSSDGDNSIATDIWTSSCDAAPTMPSKRLHYIHVTIGVHLHYPHHIIHNFASIPVTFYCHRSPFRLARGPTRRRIESVTGSLSPGGEEIGAWICQLASRLRITAAIPPFPPHAFMPLPRWYPIQIFTVELDNWVHSLSCYCTWMFHFPHPLPRFISRRPTYLTFSTLWSNHSFF